MLLAFLSTFLAAAPTSIAALPLQTVNVPDKVATFALEHLSERLGQLHLKVVTPSEIQALLGLERQKQLIGCTEEASSCTAELADALGADASLVGTMAKLGETIELSIKIISNRGGARLAGFTQRVQKEADLFEVMDRAADSLAEQLAPKTDVPTASAGLHLRNRTAIPAIVGGVALASAGAAAIVALEAHLDLTDATRPPLADGEAKAAAMQQWQTVSAVAAGVGVAAVAVAIWFYASGEPPVLTPSVALTGGAATLTIGGTLP